MTLFLIAANSASGSTGSGYFIGILISVLILGYLIYALAKPEKF
jgi:K+-transporting ATPase KdpF subunit